MSSVQVVDLGIDGGHGNAGFKHVKNVKMQRQVYCFYWMTSACGLQKIVVRIQIDASHSNLFAIVTFYYVLACFHLQRLPLVVCKGRERKMQELQVNAL